MKLLIRSAGIGILLILITGCASTPSYHTIYADDFKNHNLNLTYSKVSFDKNTLLIEGGIQLARIAGHVASGHINILITNQQNVVLKAVSPEYSPRELYLRPKENRTGLFSVKIDGIEPQPLHIQFSYHENSI
ncbi:hypothetical protein [Cellvibrio sp.]|uniref:hypothetical protein n=1 Tax=Cellvibrio sp. TaxID=1965322 RepID=UPI00396477E0